MKKIILLTVLISLTISVSGQEIFKVPELTVGEKHSNMVFMFWANLAPGIKFAKDHNISPYEYGAYYGKLFAANRNTETGFVGITAQEILEVLNGSHAQISGSYGCTSKMVLDGDWIVVTVSKND